MTDLTDLQRQILEEKRENPDASAQEVADAVGCSEGYARDILDEYDTAVLDQIEQSSSDEDGSSPLIPILIVLVIVGGYVMENGLGPIPPLH
ncbi:hypothetical protein DJ71_05410 [Halorubrum sp. E3]|nr:hypothetical protein DJ71_05410 [Halorubrum sp. E3]